MGNVAVEFLTETYLKLCLDSDIPENKIIKCLTDLNVVTKQVEGTDTEIFDYYIEMIREEKKKRNISARFEEAVRKNSERKIWLSSTSGKMFSDIINVEIQDYFNVNGIVPDDSIPLIDWFNSLPDDIRKAAIKTAWRNIKNFNKAYLDEMFVDYFMNPKASYIHPNYVE